MCVYSYDVLQCIVGLVCLVASALSPYCWCAVAVDVAVDDDGLVLGEGYESTTSLEELTLSA